MPNVFDEQGVVIKGIDEFRTDMADNARVVFADKLDGRELKVDDSSIFGRLFAVFAKSLVQNAELVPLITQSLDINSAEGQQLDNLLWNIHRIKRKGESKSTGLLMLLGDLGTFVSEGSQVSNTLTGDSYSTDSSITFSNLGANGVELVVSDVSGYYEIFYEIEGYLSGSPSIKVELGSGDTTVRSVADRLVNAVNSQSSYLTASRNNDNSVKVIITEQNRVGNFSVYGAVSIARSYMPVYATSTTYDSDESTAGQITSIVTSKLGWRGVKNPYYIRASSGVESDEEYRYRGKLKSQYTSSKYNSIIMAIKSVGGVVYENVQQNTSSNTTNSGITNNGVAITVMGGNEDEIALAIFNSVSSGIETSGDIEKLVKDINGFEHPIRFSRPKIVPLEISMSLITYPNFPINGNAKIRQAIVEWFNNLNVGEDIHYSRLYEPINSVQGFAVKNLKFGYKGGTLSLEDIIVRHDEIATLSAENIIIGGSAGTKNVVDSAVVSPDVPVTEPCTSTGVSNFVQDGFPPAAAHAKYRVNNGDWETFNGFADDLENTVVKLFRDINSKLPRDLFYTGLDSDGNQYAFYSPKGEYFIASGETVKSSNNYYQYASSTPSTNKIEFQTTDKGLSDLVMFMFGGDKTLMSCVNTEWTFR